MGSSSQCYLPHDTSEHTPPLYRIYRELLQESQNSANIHTESCLGFDGVKTVILRIGDSQSMRQHAAYFTRILDIIYEQKAQLLLGKPIVLRIQRTAVQLQNAEQPKYRNLHVWNSHGDQAAYSILKILAVRLFTVWF